MLLDFGATRAFSDEFTCINISVSNLDNYARLLQAGSIGDRSSSIYWSKKLGFLAGLESEVFHLNLRQC